MSETLWKDINTALAQRGEERGFQCDECESPPWAVTQGGDLIVRCECSAIRVSPAKHPAVPDSWA